MSEFYIDPTSRKNLTPRRLEQEGSAKKKPDPSSTPKASFQEVLKSAAASAQDSSAIRKDVVEKYKTALANGTYEIKAQELAEKMVQKIRENKKQVII